MKIESKNINKEALISFTKDQYKIEALDLNFNPKGEDSYSYIINSKEGSFLVKIYLKIRNESDVFKLSEKLRLLSEIKKKLQTSFVVTSLKSENGAFLEKFDQFYISVFPYIEGIQKSFSGYSFDEILKVSRNLALLHSLKMKSDWRSLLKVEKFNRDYSEPFSELFKFIEQDFSSDVKNQLRSLITKYKDFIEERIRIFQILQKEMCTFAVDLSIIHEDPNESNWIIGNDSNLYLLDWDGFYIGRPERDLFVLTGDNEDSLIGEYLKSRPDFSIEPELFSYYSQIWDLDEILDYSDRILNRNESLKQSLEDLENIKEYIIKPYSKARLMERVIRIKNQI